jgi:hypothetical protein
MTPQSAEPSGVPEDGTTPATPGRQPGSRSGTRARGILTVAAIGVALAVVALAVAANRLEPARTAPVYDPPVLAGQQLWGSCAGGFYARRGDTIVLTSSGHCTTEGTTAYELDGRTVRGVFGPAARAPTCPHPRHTCKASDINELVVAEARIPWGHLNVVDMGAGGYRIIEPGTLPLACEDVAIGDGVEINGRDVFRTGEVVEKGEYLHDADGDYFPCMIAATIRVATGDSGGAVLVRGRPAGVSSRSFDGTLGFTPLAEGLEQLGLELCTTPDCGLERWPATEPTTPGAWRRVAFSLAGGTGARLRTDRGAG